MVQKSIAMNMAVAVAGMLADNAAKYVRTYSNGTLQKGKVSVQISAAANAVYTLTIDGQVITYDEGAAGTVAAKRDGLIAAINSNSVLNKYLYAYIKDADELYIEVIMPGKSFSVSESDANIATPAVVTSAGLSIPVNPGIEWD